MKADASLLKSVLNNHHIGDACAPLQACADPQRMMQLMLVPPQVDKGMPVAMVSFRVEEEAKGGNKKKDKQGQKRKQDVR